MRDINVFGPIGSFYDEAAVTASDFAAQLNEAGGDDVTVHINSGGGDVFDANTMAETLRAYKGRTTASIEGLAASAASYFALTADEVVISPSALLMIHNPYTCVRGEASELRKTADMLDKLRGTISAQYVRKTGMDAAAVEALMDDETWFTAEEAVERGFADRMSDAPAVAACIDGDMLGRFRHAPEGIAAAVGEPAGEDGLTMDPSTDDSAAGAAADGAGAASRVVCVNGAFLRVEGQSAKERI